jgi:hypothetical protein
MSEIRTVIPESIWMRLIRGCGTARYCGAHLSILPSSLFIGPEIIGSTRFFSNSVPERELKSGNEKRIFPEWVSM